MWGLTGFFRPRCLRAIVVFSICLAVLSLVYPESQASEASSTAPQPAAGGHSLAQAREAFDTTWRGIDHGYQRVDLAQVERYVSPEMLLAVVGQIGCGCGPSPEESSTSVLSVPPENTYPFWFLAQISVKVPPHKRLSSLVYLAVFTKATVSSPWLLSYLVAYTGTSKFLQDSELASPSNPTFDYSVVGEQLAQFFASYVNTGGPPASGGWPLDGSVKQELEHYFSVKKFIEAGGATQNSMMISPTDHSPLFAYPGGDIVCGAFRSAVQITTPPAHPTVQPRNRSNWGPLLAPGAYASLEKQQLIDYCVTINEGHVVVPVSFFGWTYSITPGMPDSSTTSAALSDPG
jgi:hypothetical protein